jgi:hypothetical protein
MESQRLPGSFYSPAGLAKPENSSTGWRKCRSGVIFDLFTEKKNA